MVVRLRLARFGRKVRREGASRDADVSVAGRRWKSPPAALRRLPPAHALPLLRCSPANLQGVPFYRIFAADSRSPRDGKHLEQLGHYDPVPGAWTARLRDGCCLAAAAQRPMDTLAATSSTFAPTFA